MVLQNQIDEPIVSVWLNKASNQDTTLSNGGVFIFGGVDPSLYTGQIHYVPVTSSKEWQITVNKVYIGRKELPFSKTASSAIVDTGSSYILFPDYLATAFHRSIPNSRYDSKLGWLIPCRLANSRTVGDLTFVLEGGQFRVPISDIVILKSEYNEYCLSAIDSWQELPGHGSQSVSILESLLVLISARRYLIILIFLIPSCRAFCWEICSSKIITWCSTMAKTMTGHGSDWQPRSITCQGELDSIRRTLQEQDGDT